MSNPDLGNVGGPVIIPNGVAMKIQWTLPDLRAAFNILHGSVPGAFVPSVAAANGIMTGLTSGAAWTALQPFLHTGTFLAKVSFLDLRVANQIYISSTNAPVAGTGAGLPLAPQTALVITKRTGQGGQGFRGRIYIPGWSTAAQGATQVALPAAVTALQNWANGFPAIFAAGSITVGIGHKARAAYPGKTGTLHPARPASIIPITAYEVRNGLWDTQRKRAGRS